MYPLDAASANQGPLSLNPARWAEFKQGRSAEWAGRGRLGGVEVGKGVSTSRALASFEPDYF